MYSRVKKVRTSRKDRDSSSAITSHIHPDLQSKSRVQIHKYKSREFKRGLSEEDTPFPIQPKIGPYIVSD